jgi:SAM-dependent methyltransferase
MRVLDVGSGAGDVALLVAELVGNRGEVVGTDLSPAAVSAAKARTTAEGRNNITFHEGDPSRLGFEKPFDAIVGRYVLMFNSDPVAMLKGVTRNLRPGGVVVFHEVAWLPVHSAPPSPTFDRCCDWIVRTFEKVGANPQMGLSLHSAFVRAGLPPPTMGLCALIGGGASQRSGIDMIADLAVTMAPVMEETGVVTIVELDPATLRDRMIAEVGALGSVVIGRYEIGVWSRL